jgi:hypothetical protein
MDWMFFEDFAFYSILGLISLVFVTLSVAAYREISLPEALKDSRGFLDKWASLFPQNFLKKLVKIGGVSGTIVILGFLAYGFNRLGDATLPYVSRWVNHLGNKEVAWSLEHPAEWRSIKFNFREIADLSNRSQWEKEKSKLGKHDVRASRIIIFFFLILTLAGLLDLISSRKYRRRGVVLLFFGMLGLPACLIIWTERQGQYIDNLVSKYESIYLMGRGRQAPLPASFILSVRGENFATYNISVLSGISGMARFDKNRFLVVHDTKDLKTASRFGLLNISRQGLDYEPVTVDWSDQKWRANDLESVCALPGRPRQYLAAESGYWKNRYGRVFHLEIVKRAGEWAGNIIGVMQLPEDTDNIEGIACFERDQRTIYLVLGERGGSLKNPNGKLRSGYLDLSSYRFTMENEYLVSTTSLWNDQADSRDISDLFLDQSRNLWGVGTQDPGDTGPFRSIVYRIAKVESGGSTPIQLLKKLAVINRIDGLKVEALSEPMLAGNGLSIGTDDEIFGGIWRTLPP